MIENIPTEKLYDKTYIEIMNEFERLRNRQQYHDYEINLLGTGNKFYSYLFSKLAKFRQNKNLGRYVNFGLKRLQSWLAKNNKVMKSYNGVVWTSDVVKYSTMPYPARRVEYPWAFLNSNLENSMNILDMGSGISLFPVYLASKGHKVTVVDNDKILMQKLAPQLAKWSGVDLKYSLGNATKLEFDDNTFDRVFCISVLEHLEEEYVKGQIVNYHKKNLDVKAINEMLRVLKPGGTLILTFDWSENPTDKRSYRLDDIYDRVLKPFRNNLVNDEKPKIEWKELSKKHLDAEKSFPPYNYLLDSWAMGTILKK